MVEDALDIYSYAADKLGRGSSPIIVAGQSMGTAAALHVAANRKVDAVVLMAPPGGVNDLLAAMRQQAPWYVSVKADPSLENVRVSPLRDAGRVRARTLIVSGSGDVLAPPDAIERMKAACGAAEKSVCPVPGGHGDVQAENPAVRKCIAGFVDGGR
jgi:pimeloyl-ACP methyl ester carboxylesterase